MSWYHMSVSSWGAVDLIKVYVKVSKWGLAARITDSSAGSAVICEDCQGVIYQMGLNIKQPNK